MQRKINNLKTGFTLIMSLIVLLLVSSILYGAMLFSTKGAKSTVDLYLKEQSLLLAKSAIDYALLAISGHNNNISCIENVYIDYPKENPTFKIDVMLSYVGKFSKEYKCENITYELLQTDESNMSVIIDVVVTTIKQVDKKTINTHMRVLEKL